MKKILAILMALSGALPLVAQKVDYKSGLIQVDGKDLAKVVRIKNKENFGLTSTFELLSLSDEKLIIAVPATDFVPQWNDNTVSYFRFTFLTTNQLGIFSLGKLSGEKSFAKLIGESGIVADGKLDPAKVNEMIALKGKNPRTVTNYHLVSRNHTFPISLKDNHVVCQGITAIGKFADVSRTTDEDTYEFSLPEGLVVAKVSFRGGNNATKFIITTMKDGRTLPYTIDTDKKYTTVLSSVDRNEPTLLRVAKWLTDGDYL
jgi:hypothetical protein